GLAVAIDISGLTDPDQEVAVSILPHDADANSGTRAVLGVKAIGQGLDFALDLDFASAGIRGGSLFLGNTEHPEDFATLVLSVTGAESGIPLNSFNLSNFAVALDGSFDVTLPFVATFGARSVNVGDLAIRTNPVYGDQGLKELYHQLANGA
ncbi:hypothetical protein RZS08_19285, partial [Arthrospira platensis SPKY1]|nr:hypothetical protein [Arthrospira platensis SPKY1]